MTSAPSPTPPSFAAVVRTTGTRPDLLAGALQSLALQTLPCHAVVVVHGDERRYDEVRQACEPGGHAVLHASDTKRRRGHPINLGLDYCAATLPAVDYLFFLDDDDIVYPFYTGMIAAAFQTSGADVVYAASNRRRPGLTTEPGYSPVPIHHMLRENFIPINSYAIRHATLQRSRIRMSEEFEYTEDWHFLLLLLQAGFRFHAFPAVLSEFRIYSDGNLPVKRDPAEWQAISLAIRRFINTSSFPIPGGDLVQWAGAAVSTARPPGAPPSGIPGTAIVDPSSDRLIAELRARVRALENSLSWKCTAPLRSVVSLLLNVRRGKTGA